MCIDYAYVIKLSNYIEALASSLESRLSNTTASLSSIAPVVIATAFAASTVTSRFAPLIGSFHDHVTSERRQSSKENQARSPEDDKAAQSFTEKLHPHKMLSKNCNIITLTSIITITEASPTVTIVRAEYQGSLWRFKWRSYLLLQFLQGSAVCHLRCNKTACASIICATEVVFNWLSLTWSMKKLTWTQRLLKSIIPSPKAVVS